MNERKNETSMELIIPTILSSYDKAGTQEQHNVDQLIETMVVVTDLVAECLSILGFMEHNKEE